MSNFGPIAGSSTLSLDIRPARHTEREWKAHWDAVPIIKLQPENRGGHELDSTLIEGVSLVVKLISLPNQGSFGSK